MDVRIDAEPVIRHERMLTGSFYAVSLNYGAAIAKENKGRPFGIGSPAGNPALQTGCAGCDGRCTQKFSTEEWKSFVLRSIGIEPIASQNGSAMHSCCE